jgi:HEPN domain-containing protein
MPPKEGLALAGEFLRLAEDDLEFGSRPPLSAKHYQRLCNFAQQAAEKALKAVLVSEGVSFPYTHQLDRLLRLVPSQVQIPQGVQAAAVLTAYAVDFRYPPHPQPPDQTEWREALRLAEAVVAWAEEVLSAGPAPPE